MMTIIEVCFEHEEKFPNLLKGNSKFLVLLLYILDIVVEFIGLAEMEDRR